MKLYTISTLSELTGYSRVHLQRLKLENVIKSLNDKELKRLGIHTVGRTAYFARSTLDTLLKRRGGKNGRVRKKLQSERSLTKRHWD